MRRDRIANLWPRLEPKLKAVARKLLARKRYSRYDDRDLVQDSALGLLRVKSTKKSPKNLSYLISRGKFIMRKILQVEFIDEKKLEEYKQWINL